MHATHEMLQTDGDAEVLTVYTDGSCSPNPGNGGWAAVIVNADGPGHRVEIFDAEQRTTNNRMEITAVLRALQFIDQRPTSQSRPIHVCCDSCYVMRAFTQRWIQKWQTNDWLTSTKVPVKNRELWEQLSRLVGKYKVTWSWIRAHSGHPENERCDTLAKVARRRLQGGS